LLSPDGSTFATGIAGIGGKGLLIDEGGRFQLWNAATSSGPKDLAAGTDKALEAGVTFSPDSKTLVTVWYDSRKSNAGIRWDNYRVRMWNVATGANLRTFAAGDADVLSMALSPDGKTLATGSADHRVRVWDLTKHPAR
jgi:WD40 repeat protein